MVLSPQASPPIALWVVPVSEAGGVARHVTDVVRHGIPGWRVVTLCPPGPLAERLRADGAAVLSTPFGPEAGLRVSGAAVRHAMARLRPALVHSHLAYADLVCALASPPGTTLLSTEHGISGDPSLYHSGAVQQRGMAAAHSARMRRLAALIAVSRSTADVVRARWSPPTSLPIHVVHNGVDPLTDLAAVRPGLRIGSLSRLAPEKNLGLLLEAFARLHRTHSEATLALAGTGPEEGRLRERAAALGLSGGPVTFEGHVEAGEFLRRVDVVAQLSTWENHSYTLLDAVNHGLGVVATDVGGNPEIVGPGSLIPVASSPEQIAHLMVSQGLDLSVRPARSEHTSTVEDMTGQLADIYTGLRP